MSKRENTVLCSILFIYVFIYIGKNSDIRVTRRFLISLQIVWILTGKFDKKSIFETEGGLELEAKGIVNNLRRPDNPKVRLDFMAERVGSGETIFIDHKGMIDFESLSDKGIDISGFPSHESVAFNMGKDSIDQKEQYIGMDRGPASREEVIHLYNFGNIRDKSEIPLLIQAVLNGAEQAGYIDGIMFLNHEQ